MIVSSKKYAVSRKQYAIMGKQLSYVYCLLLAAYCLLFTTCSSIPKQKMWKIDIKEVYQKELQYIKARVSNDFNTMYSFQHPEYKDIVTMDKFISSSGYIQLDYSSVTEQNPKPQVYTPLRQFHTILHDIKIEKVFIDKDERYAKFHTIHIMSIFFPFARGTPVRREFESAAYWEKVNREWVILNKVRPAPLSHISGAATKNPINLPEEKAEYIEIPIKEIESVFEEKK